MATERPAEAPAPRRRPLRAAAGVIGDLLFTTGVLLALLVVYSLWWTDLTASRHADVAADDLRRRWSAEAQATPPAGAPGTPAPPAGSTDAPAPPPYEADGGIGFLHVPAMGAGYQVLIRTGTDEDTLAEGVAGAYTRPYGSAMPWEPQGNFALAAHRDGHGAKFHDLDKLKPGDPLVVETRDRWYVYRVDAALPQTSRYDTGVIAPVPAGSPYTGPGRYITLTTCTPVYTSLYRMAVWGSLVREQPVDPDRTPPPELRERDPSTG
ncbi:class E sortase [Streptomyces sp. CB01881]|uniref:class E sortase n=1 Tax=Streptomyces sp. CB01881 TaxID=2078691 RepID=UPI000CDC8C49|nr:class E sortase [Streptomyces sp. CB01881]AUY52018.1 class E sortase [Streptomyces sp. CB01881]TYC71449.1 class E sortase [Streptomyces sp. CB01881]